MSTSPKSGQVDSQAFMAAMRGDVQATLDAVMKAVNDAPDGAWIEGSEEPVRDAMAAFRLRAFEQAIQMRADAAEAAFPPSAR